MLKRGTQIAYIPSHAKGDISHPDVEYGFITSLHGNAAYCRYWSKYNPGELRTKSNSEFTPLSSLVPFQYVPDAVVLKMLDELGT